MSSQPIDPKKPDLEESTNVAEQHAEVTRASSAASREQQVRENGLEPVSVWVFITGSIIAVIAGSVLFSSNNLFAYNDFVKEGYIQAEDTTGPPPVPQGAVEAVYMAKGSATYKKCMGCHQPDGKGNVNYPPLAASEYVTESPVALLMAVVNGVKGPITAAGVSVNSQMDSQLNKSTDNLEMAALVYYLQNSFGNNVGKIYTPDQMQQFKDLNAKRATEGYTTEAELDEYRKIQVEGDFFEPGTVINKKTGEVIE